MLAGRVGDDPVALVRGVGRFGRAACELGLELFAGDRRSCFDKSLFLEDGGGTERSHDVGGLAVDLLMGHYSTPCKSAELRELDCINTSTHNVCVSIVTVNGSIPWNQNI